MKKRQLVAAILVVMKIAIAQIILVTAFTCCLYANNTSAQSILDKPVSVSLENTEIRKVISNIQKQTGVKFIYSPNAIQAGRKISCFINNKRLGQFIEEVLQPMNIGYRIIDEQIVLYFLNNSNGLVSLTARESEAVAPVRIITGKITNDKGEPLPGVSILVKGSQTGTTTLANGEYRLEVPDGAVTLVISYTGFITREATVGSSDRLDVQLALNTDSLGEIVVTGYSSQRKKDITGSVSVVDVKQFKEFPSGTPEQLLQGRAAGVNVITSGSPGGGSVLRIRGITSFGGADPLVIIDGTRGQLHDINPNDIESISILKDAGAAAIYGASGSAGVILITTKKGKSGKVTFTYDGYYGTQRPLSGNVFNLLNTQEQADVMWKALKNSGQTPTSPQYGAGPTPVIPDYILIGSQAGLTREPTQAEIDQYNVNYSKGAIYQIVKANKQGTDWFHELFSPAPIHSHSVSASGGTDRSSFLVSFGYFDQQGTMLNTSLRRYSTRVNTQFSNAKNNFRIGENAYLYYKKNPQLGGGNLAEGNAISEVFREQPIIPVYDIFGGWAGTAAPGTGDVVNPIRHQANEKNNTANNWSIQGNAFAEVDIAKHFTIRTQFGGGFFYNYSWGFGLPSYGSVFAGNSNGYSENTSYNRQWVWTNTAAWSNHFGLKHTIKVLAGTESISNYGRSQGGSRNQYFINDPNYFTLNNGNYVSQGDGISQSTALAYFGQLDYSYDEKYLLGVRFRRDGASILGPLNRWGNFPSVSLGWRISQENFMKNVLWVDDLKIRGSWGKLGSLSNVPSENQFDLYGGGRGDAYYDIFGSSTTSVQGFRQTRTGNPYTGWEEDIVTNIGLDGSFISHKLDVTIEWYKKRISGLLFTDQAHIYGVGGATLPQINIGDIQNSGIDASFTYHHTVNKDLKFDVGLLFTKYESKIVDIPGTSAYFTSGGTRIGDFVRNEEGHSISAFYGYQVVGLFASAEDVTKSPTQTGAGPGRFKYADINSDGKITDADRTYIGDPNPDFNYGLNLSATYKNFDASVFFYGSQGNDVVNEPVWWTDFYQSFAGVKSRNLLYNSWTPQNLNAHTPIAESVSNFSNNGVPNSYYVENASYLRCKSLIIGYTMPANMLKRISLSSLRVYVQAANLFTITKYSGLDPEIAGGNTVFGIDHGNYPNNQKNFIVGVNVSFN